MGDLSRMFGLACDQLVRGEQGWMDGCRLLSTLLSRQQCTQVWTSAKIEGYLQPSAYIPYSPQLQPAVDHLACIIIMLPTFDAI